MDPTQINLIRSGLAVAVLHARLKSRTEASTVAEGCRSSTVPRQ